MKKTDPDLSGGISIHNAFLKDPENIVWCWNHLCYLVSHMRNQVNRMKLVNDQFVDPITPLYMSLTTIIQMIIKLSHHYHAKLGGVRCGGGAKPLFSEWSRCHGESSSNRGSIVGAPQGLCWGPQPEHLHGTDDSWCPAGATREAPRC